MRQGLPEDTAGPAYHRVGPEGGALRDETLGLLDFPVIRQKLAERTTFPLARRLALQLMPSYEPSHVQLLQQETAEGQELLQKIGELSLHASADASPAVARAALGGILTGHELLAVADFLEVQQRARSALLRTGAVREKLPLLQALAEKVPQLQELRSRIAVCISRRGEVTDEASPTIRSLRLEAKRAYERVTQALIGLMQSPAGQEVLQDQVISVRGERLVVQVKAEMRHRVPGIVHDASNTGATLFIEPLATVELCNVWRELALEESREEARVLHELSTLVAAEADEIEQGIEQVARLDLILARARYGAAIRGVQLPSKQATQAKQATQGADGAAGIKGRSLCLVNARHPLLGEGAVPITVTIGPGWSVLVITGPNAGGKTVAMKTVGLLALMYQSGLPVPADEGSWLPVFDSIYADVGDQQSIERSVSTFSSHMGRVIGVLRDAGQGSLALLDELGTSTDPEEGSALAKSILGYLASRGIFTVATTHYRAVAAYAQGTPGMMNASVDLEPSTLKPTYYLTMGVAGRSYAMAVAARMGLPEEIMAEAQGLLEPQYLRFEDWTNELHNQRLQLQSKLQEAQREQAQAGAVRARLEAELEYLVSHREDILDQVRAGILAYYEGVRRKLRRSEAALSWDVPSPGLRPDLRPDLRDVGAELSGAGQELKAQPLRAPTPSSKGRQPSIRAGDLVRVRGLNLQGVVESIPDQGKEADVNVGRVRLRVDLRRLSLLEEQPEAGPPVVSTQLGPALLTTELDMRGLHVEQALVLLDEFLDKAARDGLRGVRIIHGRGTGVLRQVVREHLSQHPLAKSFAPETPERGGNGATVVELA